METNRKQPAIEYMPAIIRFLGYKLLPPAQAWADRLVQCRTILGVSQEAAERIGVDQCTLARWEHGEREPAGRFHAQAMALLNLAENSYLASEKLSA